MKHIRFAWILLILLCSPAVGAEAARDAYSPVVMYLKYIVDGDGHLRAAIQNNIKHAGLKGPEHHFWHGKSLIELYAFFDAWLVSKLKPTDSKRGIVNGEIVRYDYLFRDLLNADDGLRVQNVFMGWLALFMNARQQFLLSDASAEFLPLWLKDPKVAIQDYIVPAGGFTSFDAFFLRRIKPDARPIAGRDDWGIAVSPVDCEVFQLYNVDLDQSITVKGDKLNFSDLMNGDPLASKFANGTAYTCNLRLTNYHHFHSPVTGRIVKVGQVGGIYYFDKGFRHLYEHRRAYIIFETEKFGHVALVAVGQVMVNSIRIIVAEGDNVRKGLELGHFDFGGSEVVMIFQADRAHLSGEVRPGHLFKMGEKIGVAK